MPASIELLWGLDSIRMAHIPQSVYVYQTPVLL